MPTIFCRRIQSFLVFFILSFCFPTCGLSVEKVSIGILAHRGNEATLKRWQSLADYLNSEIPSHSFQITPLDFDEIFKKVARKQVDFILVNPGMYVELEYNHGVRPLVTMRNQRQTGGTSLFSGLIITLKNREDIRKFNDLKGRRFLAVDPNSLGGWLMAKRELLHNDFDPEGDFAQIDFAGTHDGVVFGVLQGQADAGTVRSDTLENMAAEGLIDIEKFHVIHGEQDHFNYSIGADSFPYPHSTDIYPEWPFAKLSSTSDSLSAKVAIALLKMSDDEEAARKARILGWDVARNYQPVHDLYRELRIGPYRQLEYLRPSDVWLRYWPVISALTILFSVICMMLIILLKLRKRLLKANHANLQLAMYDPLTNLPNRNLLKDHMALALGNAERFDRLVAVLFLDLDNFKQVNDTLGHAKGDLLLKQVAQRLRSAVRKNDTASRWGGDEFVLLLDNVKSEVAVTDVAQKILEIISKKPYDLDEKQVFSSTSIGIALFPQNGADIDALLRHADAAMYEAKKSGRNKFRFFPTSCSNSLMSAMTRKFFTTFYINRLDNLLTIHGILRHRHLQQLLALSLALQRETRK